MAESWSLGRLGRRSARNAVRFASRNRNGVLARSLIEQDFGTWSVGQLEEALGTPVPVRSPAASLPGSITSIRLADHPGYQIAERLLDAEGSANRIADETWDEGERRFGRSRAHWLRRVEYLRWLARCELEVDPANVTVVLDEQGRALVNTGVEEIAALRRAGRRSLRCRVVGRHRSWIAERRKLVRHVLGLRRARTYSAVPHPDLAWLPSQHQHQRAELILKHLPCGAATVLDIGANWGYFCHRFEELGFECTAVESSAVDARYLRLFRTAQRRRFEVHERSIFDFNPGQELSYDIVLALAIFHHFVKTETGLKSLVELLKRISADRLYFVPMHPWEKQMKATHWNPNEDEFLGFLMEHGSFKEAELLGYGSDLRSVYCLRTG